MGMVKVFNRNSHAFTQVFKDEKITIKPGGFHLMDRDEAVFFLGIPPDGVKLDVNDNPLPECLKNLWIDPQELYGVRGQVSPEVAAKAKKFICQADGVEFDSQRELDRYIAKHYAEDIEDKEVAETLVKGAKLSDDDIAKIARGEIDETIPARRGRPARGVNENAERRIETANPG